MAVSEILDFLRELRASNNREWFAAHKGRYREIEAAHGALAEGIIAGIADFDPSVQGLTVRDCSYRIYRDTRFSRDKTPYKTHIGLYVCPGGKKSGNAGYYLHLEPVPEGYGEGISGDFSDDLKGDDLFSGSLLSTGIYMPEPTVLRSVRDEIFDNGEAVLRAISLARKAGFDLDRSDVLKRIPKGYPADSEWDDYLRLKNFHLIKRLDGAYLSAPDLAARVAADFRQTYDFMSLMNRAARFAHEEM